jgi:hypothetical protein
MRYVKFLLPILFLCASLTVAKSWTPYELSSTIPYQETLIGDYVPIDIDTAYRGTLYVYFPEYYKPGKQGFDVLVHFHTQPWLIEQEFAKSGKKAIIVTINFPGLSALYRVPFQTDTTLFKYVLNQTVSIVTTKYPHTKPHIRHLSISSFSAGYSAVRELVKQPEYYKKIEEILLVDSLYAGVEDTISRKVVPADVDPFVPFVKDAIKKKKTFVSVYCSLLPETYAGTPETNAYLIEAVKGQPKTYNVDTSTSGVLRLQFDRGNFHVRGYTGVTGESHGTMVRAIKNWYDALSIGK